MAFGVAELRVLRRALALAVHPRPASAGDVKDCLRLADLLDEAMREGVRLRAFLVADLARYRAALPGTAAGYLALLEEALGSGYGPGPDDLAALRALRGNPTAAALLAHCENLAERDVRTRLAARAVRLGLRTAAPAAHEMARENQPGSPAVPSIPASRTPFLAIPGGRSASGPRLSAKKPGRAARPSLAAAGQDGDEKPAEKPEKKPADKPAGPDTGAPRRPGRPVPTPGEVFPRRKPAPPPANPPRQQAAG
ncbi:hypothetical protein ABZ354_14405 [Streptomyces sp. NPDC005925]|uniref:hypothetical protein n=1 Tax=Streptomyces sp. NPDC005925 TaxID=3157172 RepID=UPI0033CE64B4